MKNDDAKLIQRVLDGDDTAFSTLVKNTKSQCTRLRGGRSVISISPKTSHRIHS